MGVYENVTAINFKKKALKIESVYESDITYIRISLITLKEPKNPKPTYKSPWNPQLSGFSFLFHTRQKGDTGHYLSNTWRPEEDLSMSKGKGFWSPVSSNQVSEEP